MPGNRFDPRFPFPPPTGNPLARIGAALLGALALIGALFLGAFVLAIAVGVAVIGAIVVTVRVWWLRRRWRAAARNRPDAHAGERGRTSRSGRVIDVEYYEVQRRRGND